MDPIEIINRYYSNTSDVYHILVTHSRSVADKALAILKHTPKAACEPLLKLLKSAIANAEIKNMDTSNLYISECTVGQGPTLKRIRARAQGRAFRINKKTSHITLVLKEAE